MSSRTVSPYNTASAGRFRSVSLATVLINFRRLRNGTNKFSALTLENLKYRPLDDATPIGSIIRFDWWSTEAGSFVMWGKAHRVSNRQVLYGSTSGVLKREVLLCGEKLTA